MRRYDRPSRVENSFARHVGLFLLSLSCKRFAREDREGEKEAEKQSSQPARPKSRSFGSLLTDSLSFIFLSIFFPSPLLFPSPSVLVSSAATRVSACLSAFLASNSLLRSDEKREEQHAWEPSFSWPHASIAPPRRTKQPMTSQPCLVIQSVSLFSLHPQHFFLPRPWYLLLLLHAPTNSLTDADDCAFLFALLLFSPSSFSFPLLYFPH